MKAIAMDRGEVAQADAGGRSVAPMGVWDVVLFNIVAVLGVRWMATAAHNGPSSIGLWGLLAIFFFVPTALVITELCARFPAEGGLYVWTRTAFGDFHGFLAGWCYWLNAVFLFPGVLWAAAASSVYVLGEEGASLANNRIVLIVISLSIVVIAVVINMFGLGVAKWLHNLGGVSLFLPILATILVAVAAYQSSRSRTRFPAGSLIPRFELSHVNFWSQIAYAFTGLELISMIGGNVRDPKRTFPISILLSAISIAGIYILGTLAVLVLVPAPDVDLKNGLVQALTAGTAKIGHGYAARAVALAVTVGALGSLGARLVGSSHLLVVAGIHRYLPARLAAIHPRWGTPYVAMTAQAALSVVILLVFQIGSDPKSSYQILINMANVLYFVPLLYMYAAAIRLSYSRAREAAGGGFLVPFGTRGMWAASGLGFFVTLAGLILAFFPSDQIEVAPETDIYIFNISINLIIYEVKLFAGLAVAFWVGLYLFTRGARAVDKD